MQKFDTAHKIFSNNTVPFYSSFYIYSVTNSLSSAQLSSAQLKTPTTTNLRRRLILLLQPLQPTHRLFQPRVQKFQHRLVRMALVRDVDVDDVGRRHPAAELEEQVLDLLQFHQDDFHADTLAVFDVHCVFTYRDARGGGGMGHVGAEGGAGWGGGEAEVGVGRVVVSAAGAGVEGEVF